MKGKTLLCLAVVTSMLLGVFMTGPVSAQPTWIIGVEQDPGIDPSKVPGSTFTLEIWVRNVVDLVGVEFKLGYDADALTATSITYGGLFTNYVIMASEINDIEGYVFYAFMEFTPEPGTPAPFTGDGIAVTIDFTVDSLGGSFLDLYDTILVTPDPLKPGWVVEIPHDALDGYFRNTDVSATLAKKSAWPEHHHYSLSKDEDTSNDLFAIVSNDVATWVKVVFTVVYAGGPPHPGPFETPTMPLPSGAMYGDKSDARYMTPLTELDPGKYYVSAQAWADTTGDKIPDTPMGKIKTFSFSVVP